MDDLLKEAIADAKAVRETALENAKMALEEAFTPRLQNMLSQKIQNEIEDEDDDKKEEDVDLEEREDDDDMESVDPMLIHDLQVVNYNFKMYDDGCNEYHYGVATSISHYHLVNFPGILKLAHVCPIFKKKNDKKMRKL